MNRIPELLAGKTLVCSVREASPDKDLINWAVANGLFVYIGDYVRFTRFRRSIWFNSNRMKGDESLRDLVCDKYAEWLMTQPQLLAKLPELKGKVLGCWCAPKRCHGDVLLAHLKNEARR
jgi:hypothetical protein